MPGLHPAGEPPPNPTGTGGPQPGSDGRLLLGVKALFRFLPGSEAGLSFDVASDGQRFVVVAVVRQTDPSLYALINWPLLLPQ